MKTAFLTLFVVQISIASAAYALSIEVPGASVRIDALGHVKVEARDADVSVNGRMLHSSQGAAVKSAGRPPQVKRGAIVNAAGAGNHSTQVINGGTDAGRGTVVIEGSVVNAASGGGRAVQVIGGRRNVADAGAAGTSPGDASCTSAEP